MSNSEPVPCWCSSLRCFDGVPFFPKRRAQYSTLLLTSVSSTLVSINHSIQRKGHNITQYNMHQHGRQSNHTTIWSHAFPSVVACLSKRFDDPSLWHASNMRPKEYTQNNKLEWKLYTIQYLVMICSDYSDTLFRPSRGAYVNNLSGPAIPPIPLATERLSPENRKHLENNGVTRSHSPLGGWWPIGPAVIKNPWSTF